MNKKKIYCWVCDYSSTTGEGNLARFFLKNILEKKFRTKIIFNSKKTLIGRFKQYKYLSPIIGILYCWFYFIKKKHVSYVNYLPLWNFILFIFLPPKTILGPITGGALFKRKINFNFIIRRYFFHLFYKLSEFFLSLRGKNFHFATNLLREFLSEKTIKNNKFNFVEKLILKKKKKKKNIDFLIYYRNHKNKESMFNYELIKFLENKNLEVIIVGEKLKSKNVKNLGIIPNKKLNNLLMRTKYTISSNENLYSLFNIECINNNVKIFADQKLKKLFYLKNKNFIFIDFKNLEKLNKLI